MLERVVLESPVQRTSQRVKHSFAAQLSGFDCVVEYLLTEIMSFDFGATCFDWRQPIW